MPPLAARSSVQLSFTRRARELVDAGCGGLVLDPMQSAQSAAAARQLMAPVLAELELGAATVRTWMLQLRTGTAVDSHTMAALALQVKGRSGAEAAVGKMGQTSPYRFPGRRRGATARPKAFSKP